MMTSEEFIIDLHNKDRDAGTVPFTKEILDEELKTLPANVDEICAWMRDYCRAHMEEAYDIITRKAVITTIREGFQPRQDIDKCDVKKAYPLSDML